MKKHLALIILMLFFNPLSAKTLRLLNVSYDPTREMYEQYNAMFSEYYREQTGDTVVIRQSHGGSAKQVAAVINGLQADVVTLALQSDIDAIAQRGRINRNWRQRLPHHSAPYTSTIVFVVRKGNPKQIHDWQDLIRPDVSIITPNPKTSGGARWNYLAAFGWAMIENHHDLAKAMAYMTAFYKNVAVQDTGARAATNTFVTRKLGDVLITWENEAWQAINKLGQGQFDIITPPLSVLAEPVVSVVDEVVDKRGTRHVAEAYLRYLYSPAAQKLIAHAFYRPGNQDVAKQFSRIFKKVTFFTVDEMFGGWEKAQKTHFADGGTYDQLMQQH